MLAHQCESASSSNRKLPSRAAARLRSLCASRLTRTSSRLLAVLGFAAGLLGTSAGCLLVPATTDGATNGADNNGNNSSGNDSSNGDSQNSDSMTGVAGPRGEQGPAGLNCWDLNGNGQADPDEDINGDGVFDAADCQGDTGPAGPAGADGQNGTNGANGAPGADGMDLTGVLARGAIPLNGNFDGPAGGIKSAERTTTGEYAVVISLDDFPEAELPATADKLTVLITIESQLQSGGTGQLSLLFAYYDITNVTPDDATIKVSIRDLTNAKTDANFSIVVLGP